jgi:alpha-tubulin suppressor-like RCC1 family protein
VLGNGTAADNSSAGPVPVSMPFGVSFTAISSGSVALDTHGNAWIWGGSQPADVNLPGTLTPNPLPMPAGVTFTAIATGATGGLALDTHGRAWGWGSNDSGQLGTGTTRYTAGPVAVSVLPDVSFSAIASGSEHNLGLGVDGQVWAWGSNAWGQLGNGEGGGPNPDSYSATPVLVSAFLKLPGGVYAIAGGGGFSVALGPPMPRPTLAPSGREALGSP